MMDNLRTASNHVVLKIILGLIIISFVLTGVGNYLIGGNHDYAAKVNGETISRAQLENAFSNERTRQQQRLGKQYAQLAGNEQFIQQLRQQVLSQLIDTRLLQQYAHRLHLNISDKQIRQAIFEVPEFQKNGHFDNERFTSLLSSVGLTPDAYAASLRQSLANRQLVESVLSTDFMLPAEINSLVALVAQQRQVRQAVIKTSDLAAKQQATPGEISGYFQTHKDQFKRPEQFRVSYIQLDAAALQKTPDETQIQKWYSSHKSDYIQQGRERFSVIQLKTEAEAQALVKQLQQGGDFAALARQYSQDPVSAKQGGDLGWMELDSVPDEIKRIGLKQTGELSGAVKSSAGYIIVRLNDQQAEQVQSLAAVHDAVAEKVKQETAIRLFYTLQQKVNDAASNDNESLASAEQVAGVKASETGWFDQNTLPEVLNFDPVKQVLFNGSLLGSDGARGINSGIIPVDGDRAFVVRITAHQPESTKSQNEVSDQIAQQITQDKAQQIAKASAQKIVAELQQNKREAFTQAGLTFGPSQQLDRNHPQAMTETVFNLPHPQTDKPVYGSAQDAQGNMVILALDKVTEGKLTDVQKQQLVKGMTQNNAQLVFDAIMQQLRQQAKIKYGDAVHMQ